MMTMSELDVYKKLCDLKSDVIDAKSDLINQYKRRVELLEAQNQLLKKHLAKANPEYFKNLFGYYYDDIEDIRKKIAEAGE